MRKNEGPHSLHMQQGDDDDARGMMLLVLRVLLVHLK